ncbi:MAG: type II secretion system protein [Candidatus Levyibacteriota bacterium]
MKLMTAPKKGFTLIELVVVIAILGVLAAVLVTVIDPLDKIRAANDSGVISVMIQLGKAEDSFAANNGNRYTGANTALATAVTDLNSNGEIKFSSLTAPTGYTYYYFTNPNTCTTAAKDCTGYALITTLQSKKYNPGGVQGYYVYKDGQGCAKTSATAPTTYASLSCP